MAEIPADAPRSADGHYWWDGSQWQVIDQGQQQAQSAQTAQQTVQMTDDHFANMMQAAESEVREA